MNFEERENNLRYGEDFQNGETRFRNEESNYFSLYDSITVCSEHETTPYFRGQSCAKSWDDEEFDDSLYQDNDYEDDDDYYQDDSLESMDRPL
ncbi:hypothetical protein [Flavobacterium sp.]|uniref:hypothetical protein n=1 Tax=Flavobacterium sp. TaxID=239 RepID=UPI0031D02658